jgi:hypothetical protein
MDLISHVTLLGGACTRRQLIARCGRTEVDAALRRGDVIPTSRGRYALPTSQESIRLASAVAGVLSHRSAAQHWGWAQKQVPDRPEVTVPRDRRLRGTTPAFVHPHWADLAPDEVDGVATTRERTLIDCMRNLPLDVSLPIVNSAIRADDFTVARVRELADLSRGRGRARIRAVGAAATGKPANAFESVLNAQALLVPGLAVTPQLPVWVPSLGKTLHPDLADPGLRIVVEAEGFESHRKPAAITRDCERYNAFVLMGWLVLRFSWRQVMFEAAYVHRVLLAAVSGVHQPANVA